MMTDSSATRSFLGGILLVSALVVPQIAFADSPEDQTAKEVSTSESVVDEAIDEAHGEAVDADRSLEAIKSVGQAHDAALIRADIELNTIHDEEGSLVEEQVEVGDEERLDRLRGLFERFGEDSDSETPAPLVRLREVGHRLTDSNSAQLPLRPHVYDPQWNEAMAYLADDDCEEALEVATEVLGPPSVHVDGEPAVAYAFARMQMCSDSPSARREGRETMSDLAELSSAVGQLASEALGRNTNSQIDDEARSIAGHIQKGRTLADSGDVDAALAHLRQFRSTLDGGWDRHRVRLAEAKILEDAGREDEAAMAYLGLYRKTRAWRSSDRITSSIEDAEDRMDRTIIPFGDRLDRMRELIGRGRYQHARRVSRENAQIRDVSGSEVTGWTRYRQALQNERQRNRHRAVDQFEQANDLVEDPEVRPQLYFGWARALRRTDGDTEAIELYERLCDEYPDHSLCHRARYEAGRLLQYQNKHQEARAHFSDVVGLHPFSDRVPDALWRYALSAYLEEDYEAAIPPLKQIVAHYGEIQDASELTIGLKARYWIGVNYLQTDQEELAQKWLQETVDQGPLTWYGGLAISRLQDADMRVRVRRPTAQLSKDQIEDFTGMRIPDNPRLQKAAELTRIGLYDEALSEVRSHLDVHPAPEGAVQLRSALHLAVDEPNWAHWIMKSVIDESGPTHRTLHDWGLAFPLNYFELSHQYGEEYGVSPHLVQAIMRQESGFRPRVSSHAGAMGLMQLMPGTARYTARTFFENRRLTNNQILDESTNVRLGTMYIRIHHAHAADHSALALAGYNAGPGAMRSWFERYGDREVDAWVESITYRETRGYVRKVMTSYMTYKGLYDDQELPGIELQLPEELGEWGTVPEVDDVEEGEPVSLLSH